MDKEKKEAAVILSPVVGQLLRSRFRPVKNDDREFIRILSLLK